MTPGRHQHNQIANSTSWFSQQSLIQPCWQSVVGLYLSVNHVSCKWYTNRKQNETVPFPQTGIPPPGNDNFYFRLLNLLIRTYCIVTIRRAKVFISEGRSYGEQPSTVSIREGSYSRSFYMRIFISNHKEQLWQGHCLGGSYKRSSTKRRPTKWIRLY